MPYDNLMDAREPADLPPKRSINGEEIIASHRTLKKIADPHRIE
jgi:hypothetical protein